MKVQREEIERERKQFQFEIKILRETILELKKNKKRPIQGRIQQSNRSTIKYCTSTREPI